MGSRGGGALILTGALGTCHIILPEGIHTLPTKDRMAIRGSQCICQIVLTAKTVATILRLTIHNVSGNTDSIGILLDQRHIIAACAVSRRHGRRDLMWPCVTAINAVVFVYERLVSMLLRP